jgi:superfamily II DNA helicase RecQ
LLTLFSSIVRTQLIKLLTRTKGSAKEKVTTDNGIEEGCLAAGNVIVYVWRQRDAEAVAENLQASGVEGGIVVYHGGMDSGARSKSQSMVSAWSSHICLFRLLIGNSPFISFVVKVYAREGSDLRCYSCFRAWNQ